MKNLFFIVFIFTLIFVAPAIFLFLLLSYVFYLVICLFRKDKVEDVDPSYEIARKRAVELEDMHHRKKEKDSMVIQYDAIIWELKENYQAGLLDNIGFDGYWFALESILSVRNQLVVLDYRLTSEEKFYAELSRLDIKNFFSTVVFERHYF